MKGYKVFNPDWTCKNFQYKVGEIYEIKDSIRMCEIGFHFCENLVDCFNYYEFNPKNKVAKIEALGKIIKSGNKSVTNKIKIIRELTWIEILSLCNSGHHNSGHHNSGHYNSGYHNSGYHNSGNYNSGNYNSGHYNSGHYNSGHYNSGHHNSGHHNSGHYNSGYYNSGNYNSGDYSNGFFNSKDQKVFIFNKLSNYTYGEFLNSPAGRLLSKSFPVVYRRNGIKKYTYYQSWQLFWGNFTKKEKQIIQNIKNFDPIIFKKITGIDIYKNKYLP